MRYHLLGLLFLFVWTPIAVGVLLLLIENNPDFTIGFPWLTGVIFGAIAIVLSQVTAFLVDEALERRKRR